MLLEYAVEPRAIGSSWQNFRYLIEKFGFDRGRLISQFPKAWFREVYEASAGLRPLERARLEESLRRAKQTKVIRNGRAYDPTLGTWLDNALAQHAAVPFHAIIAETKPAGQGSVIAVSDVDETDPLMVSSHTWQVPRAGAVLADAMGPMLRSAKNIFFVDRFFDVRNARYLETLQACLEVVHSSGANGVRCEIHYCDHDRRPPADMIEREAHRWLQGVIPDGMSVVLYAWQEKAGGEDFHARYLLTDVGGINIEAGFSAEGAHQNVQFGLLATDFCQEKLNAFDRASSVYSLVEPVLEILSDGTVRRV